MRERIEQLALVLGPLWPVLQLSFTPDGAPAELYALRPAEDADDPRDIAAIESSKANTGDYKLKSGADYEVPEDQQVNAEKKRRELGLPAKGPGAGGITPLSGRGGGN